MVVFNSDISEGSGQGMMQDGFLGLDWSVEWKEFIWR
jgi:hypothetical protein